MNAAVEEMGSDTTAMGPFQVNVPESELTDLRRRIKATRLPEKEPVADMSQGVQLATVEKLARYWGREKSGAAPGSSPVRGRKPLSLRRKNP